MRMVIIPAFPGYLCQPFFTAVLKLCKCFVKTFDIHKFFWGKPYVLPELSLQLTFGDEIFFG